jgi:hypothetical protein
MKIDYILVPSEHEGCIASRNTGACWLVLYAAACLLVERTRLLIVKYKMLCLLGKGCGLVEAPQSKRKACARVEV